ncbi:hypothetical protein [Streptomyces sp. NPDC058614]|uniref:hypothetical protein n=1 Tax=Streptomyces sp. NPDC058614 TaxID=3346557 RepID=UPI0036616142
MIMSAMPTAKKRKTRTRTKQVSSLPAIVVSKQLPIDIDLLPGTESLVCPNCSRWCPITGHDGRNPKLVPHHTGRAGTAEPRRCIGSNRRVMLDLTIAEWRELLADAIKETSSRRPTTVLRKPKVAPTPAVSQIATQKQTTAEEEPGDGRAPWLLREMKWASTATAVNEADTRRAQWPAGGAPLEGTPVPLTTLRPERPTR